MTRRSSCRGLRRISSGFARDRSSGRRAAGRDWPDRGDSRPEWASKPASSGSAIDHRSPCRSAISSVSSEAVAASPAMGSRGTDPRVRSLTTDTAEETRALGERLASVARAGDLLCLWGDLGAGKTVFAKGFGRGLGVSGTISSPSFILMAEYPARLRLFHIDLYRLADAAEVVLGGLLDERQAEGVTLVEWPDRFGPPLPPARLRVRAGGTGDDPRTLRLEARPPELERYRAAAAQEAAGTRVPPGAGSWRSTPPRA